MKPKYTKRERARAVLLLRCAADLVETPRKLLGDPFSACVPPTVLAASWLGMPASDRVWWFARGARLEYARRTYQHLGPTNFIHATKCLLGAAALIEDGWAPKKDPEP